MRTLFLLAIKIYWRLVPAHKRRNCLFADSCSRHVYRKLAKHGFSAGLRALKERIHTCNASHIIYSDEHGISMRLKNNSVIREQHISPRLLERFRNGLGSIAGQAEN